MPATERNRVPTKDRVGVIAEWSLRDEGTVDPDKTVAVLYSDNQDSGEHDRILFIGPTEGPTERNALGHGFTSQTDEFTIRCELVIHGEQSDDATAERDAEAELERLLNLLETELRRGKNLRHPDLNDPDWTTQNPPPFEGAQTPLVGDVDGPRHTGVDQTGRFVAWLDFTIYCKTIIRGGS